MNKHEILNSISNEDNKLLISKIFDKLQFCNTKNKICSTNFLNEAEILLAKKVLLQAKIHNFLFYGGYNYARKMCNYILP